MTTIYLVISPDDRLIDVYSVHILADTIAEEYAGYVEAIQVPEHIERLVYNALWNDSARTLNPNYGKDS